MNEFDDLLKTGENILNQVNDALNTGDYSNLGDNIRGQVQDAVSRASSNPGQNFGGRASSARSVHYASARFRSPFFRKKISAFKGIGKIVLGAIGALYNGIFALASMVAMSTEIYAMVPMIIFAALTLLFAYLIKSGLEDRKLIKIYEKYGSILGRSEYFAIDDLALAAAERPDQVKKNIKKLVKKNFLPTARMDISETTVMLSDRAYEQYVHAELSRKDREKFEKNSVLNQAAAASQQQQKAQQPQQTKQAQATTGANSKVDEIIKEGNDYIENIRRLNQAIPGDEMTEKLYRLENIMTRIFTQVENEPECADDLKKFMNYYLPTTTKLLNAYVDLDRQPEVGSNITQTKKDIEGAIDVINDAFENLLDSLFQDMAWDISSDISVMKTMMAQDGLTNQSFANGTPQGFSVGQQSAPKPQPTLQPMSMGGQAVQTMPEGETETEHKPQLKF